MRTIVSVLIALTVLVGTVGQASAFDPRTFWEQLDRNGP
jgi:hypothetical protein